MIAAGSARHSGGRLAGRWISLGLALCLALPLAVRAETPVNPLRPNHAPIVTPKKSPTLADPALKPADYHAGTQLDDVWSQPAPALARSVVAANGEAPEPPSIVPPQFGEPEALPPPSIRYDMPPDAGYDPHVGGWQDHYVHHWFDEPWFS
ncbi:MAG TPA: hypothetical protein VFV87_08745, partial [Pirellulaceae bacterium]|nr:hypothetical protein [Pirellulaceae bacterium]